MENFNVMITGCSQHSKGIIDCLNGNSDNAVIKVFGVDCNERNILREGVAGCYVVPRIDSPDYIDTLIKICNENDIKVIMPYITAELGLMSENIDKFKEAGICVSVSNPVSLKTVNDKLEMMKSFPEFMPSQTLVRSADDIVRFTSEINHGEMCCKITNGCGGAGFVIVDDDKADDLRLMRGGGKRYIKTSDLYRIASNADYDVILQEYVRGLDYSVCVLADGTKNLYRVGYVGYTMLNGAVISGEIVENEKAYEIADFVTSKTGLEGNACFDFILTEDGNVKLLEVNPRLNASLPFVYAAGVNMPYFRCKQLLGYDLNEKCEVKYGLKMNKYYESKYYV